MRAAAAAAAELAENAASPRRLGRQRGDTASSASCSAAAARQSLVAFDPEPRHWPVNMIIAVTASPSI